MGIYRPLRRIKPVPSLFMRPKRARKQGPRSTDAAILASTADFPELRRAIWLTIHGQPPASSSVQLRWNVQTNVGTRLMGNFTRDVITDLSSRFSSNNASPQAPQVGPPAFCYAKVFNHLKASEKVAIGHLKSKHYQKAEAILFSLFAQTADILVVKKDRILLQPPFVRQAYCTLVSRITFLLALLYSSPTLVNNFEQSLDVLTMTAAVYTAISSVSYQKPPRTPGAIRFRAKIRFFMANMWAQMGEREQCQ
jgi:hypothetical protein